MKKYIHRVVLKQVLKVQKPRPFKLEPYKKDVDNRLEKDELYQCNTDKRNLYGESSFHMLLKHIPGVAQTNFEEARFYGKGIGQKVYYLNISFHHSNGGCLRLF